MVFSDGIEKRTCLLILTATYLVIPNVVAFADDRLTLTGKISDSAGKPIEHATVMVYHAGVKNFGRIVQARHLPRHSGRQKVRGTSEAE